MKKIWQRVEVVALTFVAGSVLWIVVATVYLHESYDPQDEDAHPHPRTVQAPVATEAPAPAPAVEDSSAYAGGQTSIGPGSTAFLDREAPVATTEENFESMVSAVVANDKVGLQVLMDDGKVYMAKDRLKVLVLSVGIHYHIRFADGPHQDEDAWISREFVRPASPRGK